VVYMLARNFAYVGLSKLGEVGNVDGQVKVYECYPQLEISQSLVHYKRVNDTFTMHITRIFQGDMSRRISLEVSNVVQTYGRCYIQFPKFTYLRI